MSEDHIPAGEAARDDDDLLTTAPDSVRVVDADTRDQIDESAGTQLVSIRMPKPMIDAFKAIAAANKNIGYQTLMKQILQRFIEQEQKRVWQEHLDHLIERQRPKPEHTKSKDRARKAA